MSEKEPKRVNWVFDQQNGKVYDRDNHGRLIIVAGPKGVQGNIDALRVANSLKAENQTIEDFIKGRTPSKTP